MTQFILFTEPSFTPSLPAGFSCGPVPKGEAFLLDLAAKHLSDSDIAPFTLLRGEFVAPLDALCDEAHSELRAGSSFPNLPPRKDPATVLRGVGRRHDVLRRR